MRARQVREHRRALDQNSLHPQKGITVTKSTSQWPSGANTGPTRPIHTCPGCGAQSSSPITHTHGGAR